MRFNYKSLIICLLEEKGLQVQSFTSLPDNKSVHTGFNGLGFYGTVSGKSWEQVYKRLLKELQL